MGANQTMFRTSKCFRYTAYYASGLKCYVNHTKWFLVLFAVLTIHVSKDGRTVCLMLQKAVRSFPQSSFSKPARIDLQNQTNSKYLQCKDNISLILDHSKYFQLKPNIYPMSVFRWKYSWWIQHCYKYWIQYKDITIIAC